jgi:hypothetical protein
MKEGLQEINTNESIKISKKIEQILEDIDSYRWKI